jgi:DNA-binding CsgD family transcriptional regulator
MKQVGGVAELSGDKFAKFCLDGCQLRVEPAGPQNASRRLCEFSVKDCTYVVVQVDCVDRVLPKPLSRREREIAFLISRGLSTKEIAHNLGISCHTTVEYVMRIKYKLGAKNRSEVVAVMYAGGFGNLAINIVDEPRAGCDSGAVRLTSLG